jgi:alkylation response protein AidB-like acyl-CoA dehydrogenase
VDVTETNVPTPRPAGLRAAQPGEPGGPDPVDGSAPPDLEHRVLLDAGWACPVAARPAVRAAAGAAGGPVGGGPPGAAAGSGAERIRAMAAAGFATLGVPTQFGGAGAGLAEVAAAQRALGAADPSVAIALNMHSLTIGLMADYWRRHRDTTWMLLEGLASSRALVASAFAEPGGSANFLSSRSEARPHDNGYRVSGVKYPCSLASTATLVCLSARVAGTDETIVALCPTGSPGLTVEGGWPSLGMADSDTAKLVFREVQVDQRLVFHRAPADTIDDTVISGVVWFAVLVTATYHGVLSGLLDVAVQGVRNGPAGPRIPLLGRATRELLALGGACRQLARDWEDGALAGRAALAAAMGLRAGLSDTRERVLAALTPVLGSRLYTRGHPAAGYLVDSLAVHHHPPSLLACDEAVGAFCAGRELSFDPGS